MVGYLDTDKLILGPGVVCLGFFDGVHLGHRAIIDQGKQKAAQLCLPLYVHTYDLPPMNLIKHAGAVKELSPLPQKAALLEEAGVDVVAVSRFDEQLMRMEGSQFFSDILIGRLHARHLVIGYDHRFGYKGSTDAKALEALCERSGIGLSVVSAVSLPDGRAISSSDIRNALTRGDTALAQRMLGRPVTQAMKDIFFSINEETEKVEEGFA